MKIRDVRSLLLSAEIDRPVRTSFGTMDRRHALLVEIVTDAGVNGLGEVWCNFPPWKPLDRIAIVNAVRPALLGADPTRVEAVRARVTGMLEILGLQWGAPGPVYHVLSGIDVALWDISARAAGLPLYRHLGGARRTAVPVYGSGLGPDHPEELVDRYRALGVKGFKLKVGFDLESDLRNARILRDAVGPGVHLMLDANQAWSPEEAVDAIGRLSAFDIFWMEEPVRCDDLEGLAEVRRRADVPIAAGENLYGVAGLRRALALDALDILQPDVTKTGGVTEALAAASLASAHGKRCALHFLGGVVGQVASVHVAAAVGEDMLPLELDANANPLRESLLTEPLTIREGGLAVPQGPGLGVALDWRAVDRYRVDP